MATIENSGSVIGAGHPELRSLRADLLNTLAGITAYQHPVSKPPILDSSFDTAVDDVQHVNAVSGLRALKDSVRRELEVLNKVDSYFYCRKDPDDNYCLFHSSFSMIPRTQLARHSRLMRSTSWRCGAKFLPHLSLLWACGRHSIRHSA
jgi:hypothetical protein